jgi:hypothetical protein
MVLHRPFSVAILLLALYIIIIIIISSSSSSSSSSSVCFCFSLYSLWVTRYVRITGFIKKEKLKLVYI